MGRKHKKSKSPTAEVAPAGQPSPEAHGPETTWTKSWQRDYFESIVIAVVLALFVRTFVVQTFKIPSSSMEDTLLVGDHILVNKFALALRSTLAGPLLPYDGIERNDVVVFKFPKTPRVDYIKRVIGLPGDSVELRDGKLYINGVLAEEEHVYTKRCSENQRIDPVAYYRRNNFPASGRHAKVPEGHYLMMGDNRNCSFDSRSWGPVPRGHVKGRALLIYWSFNGPKGEPTTLEEKVRVLGRVAVGFFTRTRWNRTFRPVR